MSKGKTLEVGESYETVQSDMYGESRIVTIITKRVEIETGVSSTEEEMEETIMRQMYKRIHSDYDCTGKWFTTEHTLFKYRCYWIIKLYETIDC